jgi:putative methyltransferase (TIGR04325 family)
VCSPTSNVTKTNGEQNLTSRATAGIVSGMRRAGQIALTARFVKSVGRFRAGQYFLRGLQTLPLTRSLYRWLVGYQRPFASLEEADSAVSRYALGGHEHPQNVKNHLGMYSRARPSDYAALFYIRPILPGINRVFDLGGSAGNLYYSYSHYLDLPDGLTWQVLDLPCNMAVGEAIAKERGAQQLQFTGEWKDADGADLLIISGSLHYLHRPLAEMIGELNERPSYILINRTPMTDGAPVATIQDLGIFRIACMLHNKAQVIRDLEQCDYVVIDEWKAPELSLEIPGYPEHSVPSYTGMFLRRKDVSAREMHELAEERVSL